MEQRKEKLLNRLARALQGEAVPYEDQPNRASNEQISMPVRRAVPTGIGQLGGFRSYGYWQPITLGVIGSVVVVAVAIGAVAYHQKAQFQKKRTHEAEFGSSIFPKRSPVDSLLGEATVTSLEGDRKLAHSAQMYHYQHQKQQMLAVDRASDPTQVSEDGSESDVEEGDFTVYECPGLAEVSLVHSTVY
ncbi:Neural proliferation differentiation and control protein 1 [Paragonimus heterotremus]|uniref:Neural proliferation differentiation and control protein 1 n=1 Tax=Paragonimus heterotremus TaxID=100268 RepID=A0A8J4WJC6_9TREM|nr:Neural proliferation differentiation and control protein 1 [Paragonimus heterotremus]